VRARHRRFGCCSFLSFACACASATTDGRPVGDVADDERIVGGERIDIVEAPYQVSVRIDGGHRCGGSILADDWVLTAAHCVDGASSLSVAAGVTRLSELDRGAGIVREVGWVVVHPEYEPHEAPPRSDLALLQLFTALPLGTDEVDAVDLVGRHEVEAGFTEPGAVATITGWGAIGSGGPLPDALRSVDVEIVGNARASRLYGRTIRDDEIAAGSLDDGEHASCEGDSGGPLVVWDDDGAPWLAGVVSWGGDCGDPSLPGIFARVSEAHAWIEEWIGGYVDDEEPEWTCGADEWLCDVWWCVPGEWVCDGAPDCEDESDELEC
jgi:trypsin